MTAIQTYHAYIERYGEKEGLSLFLSVCEFMKETLDFPDCLEWCEVIRMINDGEL